MYTARQIFRSLPISPRALQYWQEVGIVRELPRARSSGVPRQYSYEQAIELAVIAELRSRGLNLRWVRRALAKMRRHPEHYSAHWLLIEGDQVWFENSLDRVVELASKSRGPVTLVPLGELRRAL